MYTRLLSAGFWFLASVYAGSMLHGIAGVHELVGPLVGLTTAGLLIADPFHRLAAKASATPAPATAAPVGDLAPAKGGLQTQA